MRLNLKNITFLLLITTFVFSCKGQGQTAGQSEVEILRIGKKVSELDNRIGDVFQDSKGNYWFGSNGNGIYHFDGTRIHQITENDGIVDNTIRGIQEDKNGNIYIETPKGISKFDGKSFVTLKPIKSSSNEWKLEPDDLWFGYNANDLYRYDGYDLYELELPRNDLNRAFGIDIHTNPFNINNPYSVYGVDKDKEGNIWFGTFVAGAFRYDGKSFLWFDEKELSILPGNIAPGVRSIIQDKDGYFWLGNFKSKFKIEPNKLEYKKFKGVEKGKPNYFNSGLSDKEGNLWMTTYGSGVWKYNGETLSNILVHNGVNEILLVSIFQDNNGTIWLGTDNDGVYKQNGLNFVKFELNKSESSR